MTTKSSAAATASHSPADLASKYPGGDMKGPWTSSDNARLIFNIVIVLPGCITAPLWYWLLVWKPLKIIHCMLSPFWWTVFLTCLVVYLVNWVVSELRKPECDLRDNIPSKCKKVGIIGGGISGILLAKELMAEGHEAVIFERNADYGGVWKFGVGPGVMESTISSSSTTNTAISDEYLPQYNSKNQEPYHVTQKEFMEYMSAYVKKYDINKLIRYNATVEKLTQVRSECSMCGNADGCMNQSYAPEDIKWTMSVRENGKIVEYTFDYVAVCSGQAQTPKIPNWPGIKDFKGKIVHSAYCPTISDREEFVGKRVVAVGSGESASDVVREVANVSKSCSLAIRNPVFIFLRNTFGAPADYAETRSMHGQPSWLRYIYFKTSLFNWWPFYSLYQRVYPDGTHQKLPPFWWVWKLLFWKIIKLSFRGDWTNWRCSNWLVTKSENFLYALDEGKAQLRDGIKCFTENTVKYLDGVEEPLDTLLLMTGYRHYYPFLPWHQEQTPQDRWLTMFHPEFPNVAFFGFCRGQVGSLITAIDMQCRWFPLIVSGKRPSPWCCIKTLKKNIARDIVENPSKRWGITGSWFYTNYLARHHVHCEPNMLQLLVKNPRAWWNIMAHVIHGYQYRIRGPHAKKDWAIEVIEHTNPVKVWGYYFIDVALILSCPLWQFYSQLPLIGPMFEPMNNKYYGA